jgi:hypothetical protein
MARQKAQPGSATFLQHFANALHASTHLQVIAIEGGFLACPDQDRKPRFLKGEPPSDADIVAVLQTSSRRVNRTLCHLGYLEAGSDAAVATEYDSLAGADANMLLACLSVACGAI